MNNLGVWIEDRLLHVVQCVEGTDLRQVGADFRLNLGGADAVALVALQLVHKDHATSLRVSLWHLDGDRSGRGNIDGRHNGRQIRFAALALQKGDQRFDLQGGEGEWRLPRRWHDVAIPLYQEGLRQIQRFHQILPRRHALSASSATDADIAQVRTARRRR